MIRECHLKVCKVRLALMSDGSVFQVCGAVVENARRAQSVFFLRTDSRGHQILICDTDCQTSPRLRYCE